ncbi:S-layer homology domain-containing protein, partial [Acetivibrio cellulolyticus]|uniref:S-layer homology domain-containing protein n=1 Tax=Acetivibrio cellulolyticus TaxID=35830 RepID=UPI0002481CA4
PDYNVTTPEDTAVSGTVVGADVDGDTLTYAKATDPANGTVTVAADGKWTYTPNKDYNGTDSFTVEVSDGKGGTAISTITIDVGGSNDAPTVPNYSVTTPEDTAVSGTVVGTDIDGDTLTYTKATDPANGTVTVAADGNWTYTPNKDYNGTDSFTVEVSDGKGGTAISTVTITVTPVNDAPTVPDYSVTTPEDTAVSGTVVGKDIDGDTLTYTKATNPKNGTVSVAADGKWTYTPNKDYNGTDSFTVEVSDGKGGKAISKVTITVTPVNDAPTVPDYHVSTPEDTAVTGTVVGKDIDGDTLTYAKATNPTNGTVTVAADGKWTYTPNKDYNGTDSFTVEVSDGKGGKAISKITIDITPVKDTTPPTPTHNDPVITEPKDEDVPAAAKIKADLAVLIDSSTMRAGENSNVIYTITYFNKLSTEVSNTFVQVNVPDLMTFVKAENNGKLVGNEVVWDIGTLKGNAKGTVSFTLKVKDLAVQESTVSLTAKIYTKYENTELINPNDDESKIETFIFANDSEFVHTRFILGYPDGTVKPKGAVTRAEVAVIFARILNLKDKGHVKGVKVFNDVDVDFWAAEHIEAVAEVGLFKGYEDNTFRPNQPITRAELATVISKYLRITTYPEYSVLAKYFTDISGHWAEANIAEIYRYDIIKGYEDNTFRPNNTITREETITMVNQMLHRGPLTNIKPSFPDNLESNWSFGHVEEATNSHKSYYNENGSETLVEIIPEGIW